MALMQQGNKGTEELQGAIPGKVDDAPERLLASGTRIAERYEIKRFMGRGALGTVYEAFDGQENRRVGLKVLPLQIYHEGALKRRFKRFVELAMASSHPHLVTIYDFGHLEEDVYFLVREYVEGQSLDQIILDRKKQERNFTLEEVINIFQDIGKALQSVADKTFHGCLTPGNILIAEDTLKVTDLGLARILQPAQFSSLQIYYGNSYYYLAPEYDRSGSMIDQRADLYSAAVIAYEMLTGEIPHAPVVPPSVANPQVSPGIDGPFLKALALDPKDRQDNLEVFINQIRELGGAIEFVDKKPARKIIRPMGPNTLEGFINDHKNINVSAGGKKRLNEALAGQFKHRVPNAPLPLPKETPRLPIPVMQTRSAKSIIVPDFVHSEEIDPGDPIKPLVLVVVGIIFLLVGSWFLFFRETAEQNFPVSDTQPIVRTIEERPPPPPADEKPLPESPPQKAPPSATEGAAVVVALGNSPCPQDMVFIPAGKFSYGNPDRDRDFLEFSATKVSLPGFCIDRYEWPNIRNAEVTFGVSYGEAWGSCRSQGKRLCSEFEWERACKGEQNWRYPYGLQFRPNLCNTKNQQGQARNLAKSGVYSECQNSWGIYDLSGNVAEWTTGKLAQNKGDYMIRGGSFASSDWASHCTARKNRLPSYRNRDVGFRCCASFATF